jgi:hypothetical protein
LAEIILTILLLLGWLGSIFMAAPSPTARGTPFGHRLKDGYRCFYTFAAYPKLSIWETEGTPIGMTMGEKINTTTMHNESVMTYAAGQLVDFTDGQFTGAYDPKLKTQLLQSVLGVEGVWTCTYSNGDQESFYGFLQQASFASMQRNAMPLGTFTIVCTNVDPVNDTEEVPVITLFGGT